MTANTEIHSLLQGLADIGEEQNLGPVMVERIKRAREGVGDEPTSPPSLEFIRKAIKKFPAFDLEWPDEFKDQWFEIARQLFALVKQIETVPAPPALDTAARVGDDARVATRRGLRDAGDKLANAVSNLKPHLYEKDMIGESLYEQACIILWKRLAKYRDEELAESRALSSAPTQAVTVDDATATLVKEFDQFLNEPSHYENRLMARDYRHEAYGKWRALRDKLTAAFPQRRE